MKKLLRIVPIILAVIIVVMVLSTIVFTLWCNGAFNKFKVTDIETFKNPDGTYSLLYQKVGEPQWSFGSTDVRFVLKDRNGNKLNTVDATIQDDGSNAHKENIKSITWKDNSVIIIIRASEMSDKEIIIPYEK